MPSRTGLERKTPKYTGLAEFLPLLIQNGADMCSVLFCSVLFCSVLFCSVLFCSVLFCSVLFCSVLFCSVLFYSINVRNEIPRALALTVGLKYPFELYPVPRTKDVNRREVRGARLDTTTSNLDGLLTVSCHCFDIFVSPSHLHSERWTESESSVRFVTPMRSIVMNIMMNKLVMNDEYNLNNVRRSFSLSDQQTKPAVPLSERESPSP